MRRTIRALGLHEQSALLMFHWPSLRINVNKGTLTAVGTICPTQISDAYTIRIIMRGTKSPEVRVVSPPLISRSKDERIPHMYDQERLCLYTPVFREWSPAQPIATTILPWTALWLHYYEIWLATGEWIGGGHEPSDFQSKAVDPADARKSPKPR